MMRQLASIFSLIALTFTATGHAETARDILNRSPEQQSASLHSVDDLREAARVLEDQGEVMEREMTRQIQQVDLRCNAGMPDPREMTAFAGLGGPMVTGGAGSKTPVPERSDGAPSPAAEGADRRAQEACLREKIAAAREAQKSKRGFGRLIGAMSRTAARFGNLDLGRAAGNLYSANATREDLAQAARDLGLTEAEVEDCRNPT